MARISALFRIGLALGLVLLFGLACGSGGSDGGGGGTPAATAPAITGQPLSQTVNSGQSATFSVTATGTAPLTYQWRRNGSSLTGATGSSYTLTASAADNGASFTVAVSNSAGNVVSSAAILTVNSAYANLAAPADGAKVTDATTYDFIFHSELGFETAADNLSARAGYGLDPGTGTFAYFYFNSSDWLPTAKDLEAKGTFGNLLKDSGITLGQTFKLQLYYLIKGDSGNRWITTPITLTYTATGTAPAITAQPSNQTVTAGQIATFSAAASGSPAPSFQWQRSTDGGSTWASLAGATAASYSTPVTTLADSGSRFRMQASNSAGSATSSAALLTVNAAATAPSITSQPVNQTVTVGQTATFAVVAAGTAPLTYVWKRNGTAIAGAASSFSYTTPATVLADSGAVFTVLVTNGSGSKESNGATLTVQAAATGPVIQSHPQSLTVVAGQAATFKVSATGTSLSYQWLRSGVAIAGATANSYTLSAAAVTDNEATFACAVTAAGIRAVSLAGILNVLPLTTTPVITTQPQSLAVTAGQTATFTVAAAGTGPLAYQWSRGGGPIAGAIAASYTTPALVAGDDYNSYSATVSNAAGKAYSTTAVLRVVGAGVNPVIGQFTASPAVITPGGSSTLTWNAAGATSVTLDNGIGAVTGSSLVVKPTTSTSYLLTATNASGSRSALITVAVDDSYPAPAIQTFRASPAVALPGDSVLLSWAVSGAKALSIDNGVGMVSGTSVTVPFSAATTWTLTASSEGGSVNASVAVPVATSLAKATLAPSGGTLTGGGFSAVLPSGCLSASSDLELLTFPAPADYQTTLLSQAYVVRGLTSPLAQNFTVTLPVTGSGSGPVYLVVRDDANWSNSTGTPTANDRLIAATIAGGKITVTVPVSDGTLTNAAEPQGGPLAAAPAERSAVTFWAITGNYAMTTANGNFTITYPVSVINMTATHLDLADGLEKAHTLITGMGFTKGSTRDWPLCVGIEKIANEAETGYTFPGYYLQQTYSLEAFNGKVETLQATAGHELFHVFQSYYDPRTRWGKGRGPSDQLWLDEATSTWFQQFMVATPSTYVPEDFAANPAESLIGLRVGMQTGTHGYGSAALAKWLNSLKTNGILDIYKDIQKGTHPIRAIDFYAGQQNMSWWYDNYVKDLFEGNIYKAFDPKLLYSGGSQILVDRANLAVKVDYNYGTPWYSRSITMPPFSARVFVFYPGGQMETGYWDQLELSAYTSAGDSIYGHTYIMDRATKKLAASWYDIDDTTYNDLVAKRSWIIYVVVNPDDATRNVQVDVFTGSGCMRAGTPVRMAEGPDLAIETLKAGDRILAWDEETGLLSPAVIKATLVHREKAYQTLALSVAGRELHLTGNHPVRTADGRWVKAETLNPGDRILVLDEATGTLVPERIAGILRDASPEGVVYNLKTSAGNYLAEDVLVHNKCLAAGTLVETPQGPRAVELLQAGDEVYGLEAGQRVVTRISHAYQKRTALASLSGRELAPGLRVTDNHPVWTGQRYVPAGELGLTATAIAGAVYDLRTGTGNLFSAGRLLQAGD